MINATKFYDDGALVPLISEETQSFHFGKHHIGYANTLNSLIQGTEYEGKTLDEIINAKSSLPSQKIWNNAAQVFNHDFYWRSLSTKESQLCDALNNAISAKFGSLTGLKTAYVEKASEMFGSGWSWLIFDNNEISVVNTQNAEIPTCKKLLVIDLWEHAYYIDYRNDRKKYIEVLVNECLNWSFASENFLR